MKLPEYSLTLPEPVLCAKAGKSLLLRLCTALLCVIGIPAAAAVLWAEITNLNLNKLPLPPRIALAAAVGLAAFGVYRCIEERKVPLELRFYRDRLVLFYESRPSLWSEASPSLTLEVAYADVKSCICSDRRCRVTLTTRGYFRQEGDGERKRKGGDVSFSTLETPDVDMSALIKKHTSLNPIVKS